MTEFNDPTAMSAIWKFIKEGPPSFRPAWEMIPLRDM